MRCVSGPRMEQASPRMEQAGPHMEQADVGPIVPLSL